MRRGAWCALASSALITTSATWAANGAETATTEDGATQGDATHAEERPKMDLQVAPNEPPVQRSAYVHNGFYARFGVGPSYMYSALRNKELDDSADAHSFAISADLLLGGSPSNGIALGGGALLNLAPSASFESDKELLLHFTVGPFFDAFPNDREGFHLGTLLGVSGLSVNEDIGTLVGGGGAAWVGYDMWVAPEWSAGFHLQAGGSFHTGSDFSGAVFHTTLMISVLRH